jgi:hypothetical protein
VRPLMAAWSIRVKLLQPRVSTGMPLSRTAWTMACGRTGQNGEDPAGWPGYELAGPSLASVGRPAAIQSSLPPTYLATFW